MRNPIVIFVLVLLTFAAVGCMSEAYCIAEKPAYDSEYYDDGVMYDNTEEGYAYYPAERSVAEKSSRGRVQDIAIGESTKKTGNTLNKGKVDSDLDSQVVKGQLVSGVEIQQKLIYTGAFTIGVYDIELKKKELLDKVNKLGGYLQSETNTQLEIRVPAEKFFEVVKIIEGVGRLLNKYVVTKDVTEKFYDIQKRLEVKKDALNTLKEILKKVEKVEDVIALQREIRELIEEIETLEGSMRVMQSLIRHSLITIDFVLEQQLTKAGASKKIDLPIRWLAYHSLEMLLNLPYQQYQQQYSR